MRDRSTMPRPIWEHRVIYVEGDRSTFAVDRANCDRACVQMGQEGWELVSAACPNAYSYMLFFKRLGAYEASPNESNAHEETKK